MADATLNRHIPSGTFRERVDRALGDAFLKAALPEATFNESEKRSRAMEALGSPMRWRERAREIRRDAVENLDGYLAQAVERLQERGGQVHWARDAQEAVAEIMAITERRQAKLVVKSKSMVTEEIDLNRHLEAAGVEVVETDLGEYIVQLAGERPSHLLAPAIHKTQGQVRDLFSREAGETLPDDATTLAGFARRHLREKFLTADIGISGCNFLVAESGSVVLVTNEGNGRAVTSLPPVHIAVIGMERVAPTWKDLAVLLELLPRHGTGQKLTVYTSCIGGVRGADELDGPEEFHVVLLDNGRSRIRGTKYQEVLHCIRCGACQNSCPVYRTIGGHAYGGTYGGPIGAVLSPLLSGDELGRPWQALPHASSLCGACSEACPVMIPLHELLIEHRSDQADAAQGTLGERWAMRMWGWVFADARRYRRAARLGRLAQRPLTRRSENGQRVLRGGPPPLAEWTASRDFPAIAAKPFHERWKEQISNFEMPHGGDGLASETSAGREATVRSGPPSGGELRSAGPRGVAGPSDLPRADHPGDDPAAWVARFGVEAEAVGCTWEHASARDVPSRCADYAQREGLQRVVAWDPETMAGPDGALLGAVVHHLEEVSANPRAAARDAGAPVEATADSALDVALWQGSDAEALRDACAAADVGIVVAERAVATSGSVLLRSGPGRGRAVSILPTHLMVLVRADAVRPTLADVLADWPDRFEGVIPQNLTFVTGPSKSADIGLKLVVGVHGPMRVHLIVVD